ncbi:MAG: histidine kinase [Saprospiraceae bacterium]|nr:histidine kinase [Saprospiraceae bacterium]
MKLLIVDDEQDQERLLRLIFRRKESINHLDFYYAANGIEALKVLNETIGIEIVLLDINMPEMDGLTLLDHIKKLYPLIIPVIISAYGDISNIRAAMNKGAFDFLIKPIDSNDLEQTMLKTLTQVKEIKENQKVAEDNMMLKKQSLNLEMQVLRAQMNPHFVFNCLNSIDSLILSDDKVKATTYLNKFARLFRAILDSNRKTLIPLSQEIQNLKLYIELELLRSDHLFDVEYDISPSLEKSEMEVPSLLIQPVVENAIQHGIKNLKDQRGILSIKISEDREKLFYVITDNGVGFEKARILRNKDSAPAGLEITKTRIQLYNGNEETGFTITDRCVDSNTSGTQFSITLNK